MLVPIKTYDLFSRYTIKGTNFWDQSKAKIDTNRSSYGRRYTSKVCSHCRKTGHVIDTCYKKHGFPLQFKFKNHKADCNNNQQNHEGSRSEVHSQQIGFSPDQYQTLLALLQPCKSSDNLHISQILSILLLVISKPFGIFD